MADSVRSMDVSQLGLEQLNQLKQQLQQEYQQLSSNLRSLRLAQARFKGSQSTLSYFGSNLNDQALLVPLSQSLYVSGTLVNADRVLVDLGTGYYAEKSIPEAQSFIERKLEYVQGNADKLDDILTVSQRNIETVTLTLQEKVSQAAAANSESSSGALVE